MENIRMEKFIENAQCVKQFIKDYVCLLDDPVMRRIALTMDYDEAKRVHESDMICRTEYDRADKLVAMELVSFVEAVATHLGVESKCVADNWLIGIALHDLGLSVSNNENRIIACRQIDCFPCCIADSVRDYTELTPMAIFVGGEVSNALINIGQGMEKLREGKEVIK